MKTAIIGMIAAVALAVGAWAQTSRSADVKDRESSQSTYEVIVDGKVVAKGKLSGKDSKGIQVKVNGKTVVESSAGGPLSRYFVFGGDDKVPGLLKEFDVDEMPMLEGRHIPDMQWLKEHIAKIEKMVQGTHPGFSMKEHVFVMPDGKGLEDWTDDKSMQELLKEFKLEDGDRLFLTPDGKGSKDWIDGKSMEELLKRLKLGDPDSKIVIPKDGFQSMTPDSANMPTVKFEEDGSYKVMLGKKVLAEGQIESKESRSVSIKVVNDKYTVEVNGKVVAEGELPKKG
jgi:hypothetical protein